MFLASYANDRSNTRVKPRQLITRDLEPIERFVEQWDLPERALYFCVSHDQGRQAAAQQGHARRIDRAACGHRFQGCRRNARRGREGVASAAAAAVMHPVSETVPAADGRATVTAKLRQVVADLALNRLAQAARFIKFNIRRNAWVTTDPPRQLANTLLVNEGRVAIPARCRGRHQPGAAAGRVAVERGRL